MFVTIGLSTHSSEIVTAILGDVLLCEFQFVQKFHAYSDVLY